MIRRSLLRLQLWKTEREAKRLYAKVERLRGLSTQVDPLWDRGTWDVLNKGVTVSLREWSDAMGRAAILRAQLNCDGRSNPNA